jgi:tetratricopeptide (TPR) repeat protein
MDPRFAPAWAQLGRCYRVIGKFVEPQPDSDIRAEEAFRRALEINPRLSIAHKYYASLEAEIGQSQRAMVRLVQEAVLHTNDPELFAGLVHACRYCGLFDESIAAHAEARRLDPNIPTSVAGSLLLAGKTDRLFADAQPLVSGGGDYGLRVIALGLGGRYGEARAALEEMRRVVNVWLFEAWSEVLSAWLDRKPDEMIAQLSPFRGLKIQDDPEAMFQEGWLLCDAGAHDEALGYLQRAIAKGYFAATTLAASPQFNPLRDRPAFQKLLLDAETGRDRARDAFRIAGGDRLLRV